jgi:sigma-E factor negative regulatory protein RseC
MTMTVAGRVRRVRSTAAGRVADVSVDLAVACPRCAAGRGCGAGVFGSRRSARPLTVCVAAHAEFDADTPVEIAIDGYDLLGATARLYGLPLGGLVAAVGAAGLAGAGDGLAVIAGVAGLAGGMAAARWRLRRVERTTVAALSIEA